MGAARERNCEQKQNTDQQLRDFSSWEFRFAWLHLPALFFFHNREIPRLEKE